MSITSDHLPVFVELEKLIVHNTSLIAKNYSYQHDKEQLRMILNDTKPASKQRQLHYWIVILHHFLRLTYSLTILSAFSEIPQQVPFRIVAVTHTHVLDGRKK